MRAQSSSASPPVFVRQPTSTSVRQGVSDTLLHCVVNNTRGALVQWIQNGFGLGPDRALSGWQRYRYDGSVALGTSPCYKLL